jgi:hypothetical protein
MLPSKEKLVIDKIVLEANRTPLFYPADSAIPYDGDLEVREIGHLPSSRLRVSQS